LTIDYMELLKECGHPDAPLVRAFLEEHRDDATFMTRARVINKVFLIDSLVPNSPALAAG